jgi:hypothetical protein
MLPNGRRKERMVEKERMVTCHKVRGQKRAFLGRVWNGGWAALKVRGVALGIR